LNNPGRDLCQENPKGGVDRISCCNIRQRIVVEQARLVFVPSIGGLSCRLNASERSPDIVNRVLLKEQILFLLTRKYLGRVPIYLREGMIYSLEVTCAKFVPKMSNLPKTTPISPHTQDFMPIRTQNLNDPVRRAWDNPSWGSNQGVRKLF